MLNIFKHVRLSEVQPVTAGRGHVISPERRAAKRPVRLQI